MRNEILEHLRRRASQKLTWRRIVTDGALLAGLIATASWLGR